ncbi:MAG: zf-HC2 domain-containing protein [Nitrospirae bacterium]|nr:zf-HC2 domain-containing protein [Nitrospirota bacterium]
MKFDHDVIRELLPEYLKGALSEEVRKELEFHLNDCSACRDELSLLSELINIEAPDPGELFWNTLPQKVRKAVDEEKAARHPAVRKVSGLFGMNFSLRSLLYKQLPAAAVAAALFFIVITFTKKTETNNLDPLFKDPLSTALLEYDDLTEEDVPLITESSEVEELYLNEEGSSGYSYYKEVASLSPEEINGFFKELKREQVKGG